MSTKSGMRRYTWEVLRSGQPRPYADSEYEAVLTVEMVKDDGGDFVPNPELSEIIVKRFGCALLGGAIDPSKSVHGFELILQSVTALGDGKHRFFATQAYAD